MDHATVPVPVPVRIARVRRDTPERWQSALRRAIANGLEVFQVDDSGERMVTSASRLDTLHRSDGRACTCEAALSGDPVCQHRAAVRFVLGWLAIDAEPAPVATAPTASDRCRWCFGQGMRWVGAWDDARWVVCPQCHGTGMKPEFAEHVDRAA